jgi:hypothetical protein
MGDARSKKHFKKNPERVALEAFLGLKPELEHSIDTARTQSKFVYETLGSEQKMVWGTWE